MLSTPTSNYCYLHVKPLNITMSNIPEFSVSELSSLTKNLLEENFSLIRVKGEITNVKRKRSLLFYPKG